MIIAQGPCEVTAEVFRPFVGRPILYEGTMSSAWYAAEFYSDGIRLRFPLIPQIKQDIPWGTPHHIPDGVKYSVFPRKIK